MLLKSIPPERKYPLGLLGVIGFEKNPSADVVEARVSTVSLGISVDLYVLPLMSNHLGFLEGESRMSSPCLNRDYAANLVKFWSLNCC